VRNSVAPTSASGSSTAFFTGAEYLVVLAWINGSDVSESSLSGSLPTSRRPAAMGLPPGKTTTWPGCLEPGGRPQSTKRLSGNALTPRPGRARGPRDRGPDTNAPSLLVGRSLRRAAPGMRMGHTRCVKSRERHPKEVP
jgi:hypothetical protein